VCWVCWVKLFVGSVLCVCLCLWNHAVPVPFETQGRYNAFYAMAMFMFITRLAKAQVSGVDMSKVVSAILDRSS
jgi:hypothetical protein